MNNTDYTLLECQRRENLLLSMHIGMIEQLDSIEKLFRCGLIKRFDRKPTFSEKEKVEKQKDTPRYKQYVARIQRIMDSELKQRIKDYQTKDIRKTPNKVIKEEDSWKLRWKKLIEKLTEVSRRVEKET